MAERSVVVEQQSVRDASAVYSVELEIAIADDVPPGYKRTEVGVVPEDWGISRIDQHASITTGNKNTQDKIDDGAYPFFVRSQNVERINTFSFEAEAVLTAGDGVGTGKVFHHIDGRFDVHQRVYCISGFAAALNGKYFFYQFSSRFYDRIMAMTAKSSVDSVRREMIAGMPIPVPTTIEQCAIATALSDADALIESLDRLIAKKRAIKQATMQQLLTGQTRLPGFTGKWETKRLGDLLTVRYGRNQSEIEKYDGRYPILATGGEIGRTDIPLYERPSVLIGRKGTIDEPRFMDSPFWTVDTLFYTEIHETANPKFMFYIFTRIPWRDYNEASGVPSLNRKTIERTQVFVPCIKEQIAIASVLSDIDTKLEALERRRDKARQIKQGMMQQLLTGRVRLVQPKVAHAEIRTKPETTKGHSKQFNEAVVISMLAKHFGTEGFPLGRKRYTKLSYLLHRHTDGKVEDYLKKAAGPYNPKTKYGGAEKIALKKGYLKERKGPRGHSGFIVADNVAEAERYFHNWYGPDAVQWLDQFRFKSNDELEVLATVDMAAQELRAGGRKVDVSSVKGVIQSDAEWQPKLNRKVFSDEHIAQAITQSESLLRPSRKGVT